MKHILCIILAFLMLSATGAAIAVAALTDPLAGGVQVNADKLVADGIPEDELIAVTQAMVQARFSRTGNHPESPAEYTQTGAYLGNLDNSSD